MIVVNPAARWSASQLLDHPWLNEGSSFLESVQISSVKFRPKSVKDIDQDLLDKIVKYGFERQPVIQAIVSEKYDQAAGAYYLLAYQKIYGIHIESIESFPEQNSTTSEALAQVLFEEERKHQRAMKDNQVKQQEKQVVKMIPIPEFKNPSQIKSVYNADIRKKLLMGTEKYDEINQIIDNQVVFSSKINPCQRTLYKKQLAPIDLENSLKVKNIDSKMPFIEHEKNMPSYKKLSSLNSQKTDKVIETLHSNLSNPTALPTMKEYKFEPMLTFNLEKYRGNHARGIPSLPAISTKSTNQINPPALPVIHKRLEK